MTLHGNRLLESGAVIDGRGAFPGRLKTYFQVIGTNQPETKEILARYSPAVDEIGALYRDGRRRISEIAAGLGAAQLQVKVPACPGWTVRDVVAHLAGACTDTLAGNLDGATTAVWADAQVEERRSQTIEQLLEEWSAAASVLENHTERLPGPLGTLWLLDSTTTWSIGDSASPSISDATPTLACSSFELFRALTGRRSPSQMARLDWSVAPFLPAFCFGTFTTRATDLVE